MSHDSKSSEVRRADFPALREFLRGYLHQDMREEYASVASAVKHFWMDADAQQREFVREEWDRLTSQFKDRPLAELNRALTRELGSAQLLEPADVKAISAAFKE
jgi:hypothetical protein